MIRSAYAATPALVVPCPECLAAIGHGCTRPDGTVRFLVHSARRKAADDKRTAEVNPHIVDTFEIPPEVPLPPTHPEPRILAHHKVRS